MNPLLWLFGYQRLRTDAANAPRTLNFCMEREISFCDFAGETDGGVSISCFLPSAKRIRSYAEAQGFPVTVEKTGGLPLLLWQRKKRWGLILGAMLSILLLVVSEQFVWDVRVFGNEQMTEGEVIAELAACGFGEGSPLKGFYAGELENRVLLNSDRLSWISIHMEGTVAVVQVVERTDRQEEALKLPANLIATADGQIEGIELYRGDCVVKLGQAVRAGELLVSGVYDSQTQGFRYTRAAGRILARTERTVRVEIPLEYVQKCYTDEKIGSITLNFFQKSMKIYKSTGNDTGACDIIEEVKGLSAWGLSNVPVLVTVQRLKCYEEVTRERTEEEAIALAYEALSEQLGAISPEITLLSKQIETTVTDASVILECRLTCIENIAEQVEFEVQS